MNLNFFKDNKVLAIIPARSGSKGLKNKNIKTFCKKPLIFWAIKAAKKSKLIDKIIVSTDSRKIKKICKDFDVDVPFLRPKKISQDNSKSIELIVHAINYFKKKSQFYNYVILLEPTSPLTSNTDIDKAIRTLYKKRKSADAIVGVSQNINKHPINNVRVNSRGHIKPYQKKLTFVRRQNLDKLYYFDGSLYVSKTHTLIRKKSFYHNRTLGFVTPKWKSIEIDDLTDFIAAEAIFKNKKKFEGIRQ